MKILWISEAGYSSDLALSCVKDGHQVKLWIKETKWKQLYDGILDKIEDWQPFVNWSDLIVFDHSGMSNIWKQVKDKKPCFGGSEWADKLEKDRGYAHKIFEQIGLKRFESLKVNKISEAIDHVRKHKVKHVVKPVGKEVDSHHLIISEDDNGEDAIALLEKYENDGLHVDYLEIEEKKQGIEVGISGWFNGKDWIGDINVNFEHKRYATGFPEGIGPLTGEMGTAMIYQHQSNPFFQRTLAKLKPILIAYNYRGQIDVSFIVDKMGTPFPLEATPRLGYPACMIESALQITPWAELFYNLAVGSPTPNKTKPDWAIGIVVLQPGFPSTDEAKKLSNGIPILNLDKQKEDQIHLVESRMGLKCPITAPGMGYPAVVTGTALSLAEAKIEAYRPLSAKNPNRFRIPNSFWRVDIGDRVIRQMPDIQRFGIVQEKEVNVISILLK